MSLLMYKVRIPSLYEQWNYFLWKNEGEYFQFFAKERLVFVNIWRKLAIGQGWINMDLWRYEKPGQKSAYWFAMFKTANK